MAERQKSETWDETAGGFSTGDPALLIRIAWADRWQDRKRSIENATHAIDLLRGASGERVWINRGLANVTLAWQAKWRGDFDLALDLALKAEQHLPEKSFPNERAELYSIMGVVHYSRHRLDLADGAAQRGMSVVANAEGSDAHVDLLTTVATIQRYRGDLRLVGETVGKARRLAKGAMLARVEHNVARWMQADDAPKHALGHAETALKLCVEHRNNVVMPYAHEVAGACLVDLGEFDEARAHFIKALDLATKDGDSRAQCQIIRWYARMEKKRHSLIRARDLYLFGREIARRMDYTLWEKTFARCLADVYEELGDLANSVECHKRAWKLEEAKRR